MNLLSIVAEKNADQLLLSLNKQIESFKSEGIVIEEQVIYKEPLYIINYDTKTESIKNYPVSDFISIFKYCIANALFEHICFCEEPDLAKKIIDYDYYYFNQNEREQILKNTMEMLKDEKNRTWSENEDSDNIKTKTIKELMDFLQKNSQINLQGFITFRLREYIFGLEEMVERAVEDFLIDKEYNEFIKLLKYFVDIQEAKIEVVHVVIDRNGRYKLYNSQGTAINNDYLKNIALEVTDKEINYEDLLISSLITIAPNKIYIHGISSKKDKEIAKTISKVFADRIEICEECDWCRVKLNAEKE